MNDALEILDEVEKLINFPEALQYYIEQKRLEFAPASGDCCG
jgi:hypothetical protein